LPTSGGSPANRKWYRNTRIASGYCGKKTWEDDVAKGQLRSNREKKKPKADKNKIKAAPPASPFASARFPGKPAQGYGGKKTP
jgi:hypothetical protein